MSPTEIELEDHSADRFGGAPRHGDWSMKKMVNEEDVVHLVNSTMDWQLTETASAKLTDGKVSEDLQRDRVRQLAQWLRHFPDRLPKMKALTRDGQRALERARETERNDRSWRL